MKVGGRIFLLLFPLQIETETPNYLTQQRFILLSFKTDSDLVSAVIQVTQLRGVWFP